MRGWPLLAVVGLCLAPPARAAAVEDAEPAVSAGANGVSALPPLALGAASLTPAGPVALAPPALLSATLPAAAASAPAAAPLPAQMRRDAAALGRPFKTIHWDMKRGGSMGERDTARIHRVEPGPDGRAVLVQGESKREIKDGEKLIYVMLPDGTIEAGSVALDPDDFDGDVARERGVKHMQVANGREVVFAGELVRRGGALKIDLNSGGYSAYGMDPRWEYNELNTSLLKRYAETILAEPVSVPAHGP